MTFRRRLTTKQREALYERECIKAPQRRIPDGTCSVSDCAGHADRWANALHVCERHAQRWQAYGTFDLLDRRRSANGLCTVPGCRKVLHSKNSAYCRAHYFRLRRGSNKGLSPVKEPCEHCGGSLTGNKSRFCSERCAWRHYQDVPATRDCVVCQKNFQFYGTANTCSDECARSLLRHHNQTRRAREIAPGRPHESFYDREIFRRDNWTCQICKQPVAMGTTHPFPKAPTIDHIIPLSRDGLHLRRNVQTAHAACNMKKHTKLMCEMVPAKTTVSSSEGTVR